jgi:hypothetical protein
MISCSETQKKETNTSALILMEETVQEMCFEQSIKASAYTSDLKSEFYSIPNDEDYNLKKSKLKMIMGKVQRIDYITLNLIDYIDKIKGKLIDRSGEEKSKIINISERGVFPDRLNLYNLKNPLKNNFIKDSIELNKKITFFRDELIYECANYEWNSEKYKLDRIGTFSGYSTSEEFDLILDKKLSVEAYNFMEDKYVLKDLYIQLHNTSMKLINQGTSNLLANLCLLSVLQHDVLAARAMAIAHWKSKISTGEYGFNSIETLVEGPEIVKQGSDINCKVFIAFKDSEQKPDIKVDNKDVTIRYNNDGSYLISTHATKKGTFKLNGSISIRNKSGIKRTESFEKTIVIE